MGSLLESFLIVSSLVQLYRTGRTNPALGSQIGSVIEMMGFKKTPTLSSHSLRDRFTRHIAGEYVVSMGGGCSLKPFWRLGRVSRALGYQKTQIWACRTRGCRGTVQYLRCILLQNFYAL